MVSAVNMNVVNAMNMNVVNAMKTNMHVNIISYKIFQCL